MILGVDFHILFYLIVQTVLLQKETLEILPFNI